MSNSQDHFEVVLTEGAERDLEALFDYIADIDCLASANRLLDQLLACTQTLSRMPQRGSYPKELSVLGIKEYRQLHFKPYRIIYRVMGEKVVIYLIADGRRDMPSVLGRRLLGS